MDKTLIRAEGEPVPDEEKKEGEEGIEQKPAQ